MTHSIGISIINASFSYCFLLIVIMLNVVVLSVAVLSVTLSIKDTQQNDIRHLHLACLI
jgi:hypothetical protein